jgi:hypothetical protein
MHDGSLHDIATDMIEREDGRTTWLVLYERRGMDALGRYLGKHAAFAAYCETHTTAANAQQESEG